MLHINSASALSAQPRSVALGVFDGLHIGHRAVICAACGVRHKDALGPYLTSCILSLTDVPKTHNRLADAAQLDDVCETLGADEWVSLSFNDVHTLTPDAFVEQILHRQLHAKVVCCGEDYHFGCGGKGDAALLTRLCEPLGITVRVIPSVTVDNIPVSTTRILQALSKGDMPQVRCMLGRPFYIEQPVSRGNGLGHTFGFPTLNQVWGDTALPRFGVYASLVTVNNTTYHAVTNIGIHPTVGGTAPQAETCIDGFDGDLYGQTVRVELVRFLRDEQHFESKEALTRQIAADRAQALACLAGEDGGDICAVLFDFDDTLQDRRAAFLSAVTELLTRYMPDATDEQIAHRAQVMLTKNAGGYVNYADFFKEMFERWPWQGIASSEALHREYFQCFPSHTMLFDDTLDTLHALKQRGYLLGVITNGARLLQNRKLDMCGIRPLLNTAVVSGDEGVHKPDPALFRRVAARLCLSPSQCVYVGDHPVNDIQGAREAGMHTVFLNAGNFPPPADTAVANSPSEVLAEIQHF